MITAALLIFTTYLVYILCKVGIIRLPSLSDSFYQLKKQGWLFQVSLGVTAMLLVPVMIEVTPEPFKVADDILIIESCYNRKLFYAGKITDIQLKDENGDFHYCTDEVDFKNKIKDIPFLSSPTLNLGIANY